jgi:hypothetical protein
MSKPTTTIKIETKDDNIYYNLSIINNTQGAIPANFNQTLTNYIIDKPEDYYLSCVRFFLDTSSLPIFLFESDTTYWITVSYDGVDYPVPVIFTPSFFENSELYKNPIYSYQDFINMINTAIVTACAAASVPGDPPYLYYDPKANGLISIFFPTSWETDITDPTVPQLYMNSILYYFFDNFLYYFYGEGLTTHKDYMLRVQSLGNGQNTSTYDISIPAGYYKMSQEYVALNRWKGPSSIAFQSYTMNIRTDYTSGTNNIGDQNSVQTAGTGIPIESNITDFIPYIASNDAAGWRGNLLYTPTSQYRLIDLLGNKQNTIDINIVWRDIYNNAHQFLTAAGSQTSLKLLFVKKSLYKNFKESHFTLL